MDSSCNYVVMKAHKCFKQIRQKQKTLIHPCENEGPVTENIHNMKVKVYMTSLNILKLLAPKKKKII